MRVLFHSVILCGGRWKTVRAAVREDTG